jgi:hypothetical protein
VVNLMEFFLLDHLMKSMNLGQFRSWVGTSDLGRGDEDLVKSHGWVGLMRIFSPCEKFCLRWRFLLLFER